MTTARSSWRSRLLAAIAIGLIALAATPTSAHRRDEYLQAARIAIDPARVEIEIDLTPGIALAHGIVADIDRDRNGSVGVEEARAYALRVRGDIRLEVDGRPLPLELIDRRFPTVDAMFNGEGTIQIRLAAPAPSLAAGAHRLRYRNVHRQEIGVYLANALVPTSPRVAVLTQRRDVDQRELVIEYALRDDAETPLYWWLPAGVAGAFAVMAGLLFVRRRQVAPER